MKIKKISLNIGIVIGVALSIFAVTFLVVAWTGPTAAPPSGNLPAPLSAGSGTEYKGGALGVGGLFETDTSTHLAVSGGNVGIGTTSPATKLSITSSGVDGLLLMTDTANVSHSSRLFFQSDSDIYTIGNFSNRLEFRSGATIGSTSGTTRMVINSSGNVGIGTTSPTHRLHVSGNIVGSGITGSSLTSNSDILMEGTNSWLFHTPNDGRTEMYFGKRTPPGGWTWPFYFLANGTFGASVKSFSINHPLDSKMNLVHACIEGPEAAVFYRGESALSKGKKEIILPSYFEALTRDEGITIQLTPKGEDPYVLSYTDVEDGRFVVYGTKEDGYFSWEVKAVRADVDYLEVEIPKEMTDI